MKTKKPMKQWGLRVEQAVFDELDEIAGEEARKTSTNVTASDVARYAIDQLLKRRADGKPL